MKRILTVLLVTSLAVSILIPSVVLADYHDGVKFNDVNQNGVKDEGEEGLAGWTIYADVNDNGVFDDGEPFDITGSGGFYTVTLSHGLLTYKIREVAQAGWTCTFPTTSDTYGPYYEVYAGIPTYTEIGNYYNNGGQEPTPEVGGEILPANKSMILIPAVLLAVALLSGMTLVLKWRYIRN